MKAKNQRVKPRIKNGRFIRLILHYERLYSGLRFLVLDYQIPVLTSQAGCGLDLTTLHN